jgi:hypothetical protein
LLSVTAWAPGALGLVSFARFAETILERKESPEDGGM